MSLNTQKIEVSIKILKDLKIFEYNERLIDRSVESNLFATYLDPRQNYYYSQKDMSVGRQTFFLKIYGDEILRLRTTKNFSVFSVYQIPNS